MRIALSLILTIPSLCLSLDGVVAFEVASSRSWIQACNIEAKLLEAYSCINNKLPGLWVNNALLLRILSVKAPSFCSLLPGLKKCWDPVVGSAQACLPDAGKRDVELQRDAIYRGFDFLCENNEEKLRELLSGQKCLGLEEDMGACNTQELVDALLDYGDSSVFNQNTCSMLGETKNCTIKTIAKKCDSKQATAVQGFLNTMKVPCDTDTTTTPSSFTFPNLPSSAAAKNTYQSSVGVFTIVTVLWHFG